MPDYLKRAAILLLALSTGACSTGTRLAYNNLGTLARWEAGKYVELTPDQKTAFDREFTPVWDWHRQTQLPRYATELRAMAKQLEAGNPDRAALDRIGDDLDGYGTAVADRARPGLARLLALMTDAQVETLLADRRKEFDKAFRKQSARKIEDRRTREQDEREGDVKTWIGPLNPAQQALLAKNIEDDIARGAFDPARARTEKNRQLERLAALLAQRRQPDFEQRLKAMEDPATPDEKQAVDASQERARAQLAALAATLDATQRQYLSRRLRSFAEDFDVLAARPVARSAESTAAP